MKFPDPRHFKADSISDDEHRYALWRNWSADRPLVLFILLNPSTASGTQDDNTTRKLNWFASNLGFGGYLLVNLFAWRATSPADLKRAGYPIGPLNDDYLAWAMTKVEAVICGWGANARGHERAAHVLDAIRLWGHEPLALRLLPGGVPEHPLYLPAASRPVFIPT